MDTGQLSEKDLVAINPKPDGLIVKLTKKEKKNQAHKHIFPDSVYYYVDI